MWVAQPVLAQTRPKIYAYYYLWWSNFHWHNKLGTSYPYSASPLPLPATLGADGCAAVSLYNGNQLFDVSNPVLHDQDVPGVIEQDVRNAHSAGLSGFLVNWAGTGDPNQSVDSISYSRRLDAVIAAVNKLNAEGKQFSIILSYKASPVVFSDAYIHGDMTYLWRQYGNSPAYDHSFSQKPIFLWEGSRKYSLNTIAYISNLYRSKYYLIGDETYNTWGIDNRDDYLDGTTYYWSSQNPYNNVASFTHIQNFANEVRASSPNPDGSRKLWIAPMAPGYNSQLLNGGVCTPRIADCPIDANVHDTLTCIYRGNKPSNPDAWSLISWNEIAEGTYIMPMTRWGEKYLHIVRSIIRGSSDYVTWKNFYTTSTTEGPLSGDFNRDSRVSGLDYVLWSSYFQ